MGIGIQNARGAALIVKHEGGPLAAYYHFLIAIIEVLLPWGIGDVYVGRKGCIVVFHIIMFQYLLAYPVRRSSVIYYACLKAQPVYHLYIMFQPDHKVTEEYIVTWNGLDFATVSIWRHILICRITYIVFGRQPQLVRSTSQTSVVYCQQYGGVIFGGIDEVCYQTSHYQLRSEVITKPKLCLQASSRRMVQPHTGILLVRYAAPVRIRYVGVGYAYRAILEVVKL